ncbi:MarR family transcriptional regulator [Rubrobacter aplysinae]|uniref:MarR family transcriptional regulator n=1 Tax=Rubrobacter aplysinae TaxID=909625 RepID=UPI00064C42ED|nr:MarR family transcriptional regulator [Rubrobacter aplysinae]
MEDRQRLVDEILAMDEKLQRIYLADDSNPLLALDLTIQQLKALLILSFSGSASGQELSEGLGIHLATATGLVDRLVAQGMAYRAEDSEDRRVRRAYPTTEGTATVERIYSAGMEQKRKVLSELSLEGLEKLRDATEELGTVAAEQVSARSS